MMSSSRYSIPPARAFRMGGKECPDYAGGEEKTLASLAAAAGEYPVEIWLRCQLDTLREIFERPGNKAPDADG